MKNFTKALFLLFSFVLLQKQSNAGNGPVIQSMRSNLFFLNADNSTVLADGNLAQYNNAYSGGVDFLDAVKLNNINETFGLMRDSILLSIERRPIIAVSDTLFFNLTKTTQRNYQFQFTATALNHPNLVGLLVDNYLNTNTPVNLNGVTSVNFTIDANAGSQKADRFMIIFETSIITPVHFTSATAFQEGANTDVNWSVENELNINQYDIERSTDGVNFEQIGSVKANGTNSTSKYAWVDATAVPGNYFYRIKSVGANNEMLYSAIVNVKIATTGRSVVIFPNPVHNGIVGLQFNNMPKGIYNIKITNLSGQEVAKQIIDNNSEESASQSLSLNKNITKGIYQMEIIGPDNSKTYLKILSY